VGLPYYKAHFRGRGIYCKYFGPFA
jgi:hypothetical protein